ncbi:MAG: hypothetical protein ACOVOR_00475 [Rhabdochlamydiaceae bacterium]
MSLINMCRNSYTQIKEMTSFAYNNPREAVCNKKTALAVLALGILAGASYTVKNGYHKPFIQKMVAAYENTSIASKQKAAVSGFGLFLGANLYSQHKLSKELKNTKKMLTLQEVVKECAIEVKECAIKERDANEELQTIINQLNQLNHEEEGRPQENPAEEGGLHPRLIDARRKCEQSKRALTTAALKLLLEQNKLWYQKTLMR